MKTSILIYFLFLSFINISNAKDVDNSLKESTKNILQDLSDLNRPLSSIECSINPQEIQKKSCAHITDTFCKELKDNKNLGNMKVFDGQILSGKSSKSDFDLSILANDKALIDSVDRLPVDTKKHLSPAIEKLATLLMNESNNPMWYFNYTRVKMAITKAMEKVANERFDKTNSTKTQNNENWTIPESISYQNETRKVFDEITYAKYKQHPNWLRVESTYVKAKELLLKNIETLDIPLIKRNELKEKITSVELTLPSLDPKLMGTKECASTEVNAYYWPLTNKFTVCAGFFNRYQSESALIFTIAHELAHSIDSERQVVDQWKKEAPIQTKLNALVKSKNQTFSCTEWNSMNEKLFIIPTEFNIVQTPFDNLYSCLRGEVKTNEINLSTVLSIVEQQVKKEMEALVKENAFSMLVEKNQNVENESMSKEVYYRPDIQLAAWRGYNEDTQSRIAETTEIFMQSFYCALENNKLTPKEFEASSKELKSNIMNKALEQTTKIKVADRIQYYSYCGKNCSGLADSQLAVDISEKKADWLAVRAYPDYLKTLAPENREQASAMSTSLFCISGLEGGEHSIEEKAFYENYRRRRISLYTPEISRILGCSVGVGEEGDSKCKP